MISYRNHRMFERIELRRALEFVPGLTRFCANRVETGLSSLDRPLLSYQDYRMFERIDLRHALISYQD